MIRKILALGASLAVLTSAPAIAKGFILDDTLIACPVQEYKAAFDPATSGTVIQIGSFITAADPADEVSSTCFLPSDPGQFRPFEINLFGNTYDSFYLDESGILTFGGPLSQPVGTDLFFLNTPAIAPFFGNSIIDDIADLQLGYLTGSSVPPVAQDQLWLTWFDVRENGSPSPASNQFQLALVDQGNGDFDLILNYAKIEWDPGQAGFTDGNGNGFVFPGSGVANEYIGDDDPFSPLQCNALSLACNMLNDGSGPFSIDFDNDPNGVLANGYYKIEFRDGMPTNVDLVSEVPLPAAVWLFGVGLAGLVGFGRRNRR